MKGAFYACRPTLTGTTSLAKYLLRARENQTKPLLHVQWSSAQSNSTQTRNQAIQRVKIHYGLQVGPEWIVGLKAQPPILHW